METPVFEEFEPVSGCECPGCAYWRRVLPYSLSCPHYSSSSPSSSSYGNAGRPPARRALAVATAASAVLGAGHAVPAVVAAHSPARPGVPAGEDPGTPQGGTAPLHGPTGRPADGEQPEPAAVKTPPTTRAEIINRAKKWVATGVPYSMTSYWSDGYRQDCSGYVSMAWNLGGNEWTGSLGTYAERIPKEELQPGDILLFHNPQDPQDGSHVTIFGGWTDYTHTYYLAYEQTRPHTRKQSTPYGYWSNAARYEPYRYKGLVAGSGGAPGAPDTPDVKPVTRYPGAAAFGPGANNAYVTQLGRMLVDRGGARFYRSGPGPRWSDADRRATQAFQWAQGWRGADADGLPGPTTWAYLVGKKGRDIPPEGASGGGAGAPGASGASGKPAAQGVQVPVFPGRAMFRPGAHNEHVTLLGEQLVKKGFGKHYTTGPGPRWSEADRRNVEAFQRAQGWRGGAADGYPGPETWRRLFF
ncbi:peptidoglycan-binding protein [Streptomyces sp. NPDC002845]